MNKKLRKIISVLLILVMIGCAYIIYLENKNVNTNIEEEKNIKEIIDKEVDLNIKQEFSQSAYNELASLNEDFVGYLFVGKQNLSVVAQPVVQTNNNSYYLHRTFSREWATNNGNPFMDCYSTLDSTNITIYGHNNSWKPDIIFSHLNDVITDQNYYEENSEIRFYLADGVVREYKICYAYYITEAEFQSYDFAIDEFDSSIDFDSFIAYAKNKSKIENVNGEIYWGDCILTLQTCKRMNQDVKVIVVAKEVNRTEY